LLRSSFMAYEEMIPPETFFNADNLRDIVDRARKADRTLLPA
jgi:hypothetical protein